MWNSIVIGKKTKSHKGPLTATSIFPSWKSHHWKWVWKLAVNPFLHVSMQLMQSLEVSNYKYHICNRALNSCYIWLLYQKIILDQEYKLEMKIKGNQTALWGIQVKYHIQMFLKCYLIHFIFSSMHLLAQITHDLLKINWVTIFSNKQTCYQLMLNLKSFEFKHINRKDSGQHFPYC